MQNARRGLIKEQVDIEKLPALDPSLLADHGADITMGDLHGNFLKLLFLLVKHGIITNLSADHYAQLVAIYNARDDIQLDQFNAIINQLNINPAAALRLIGDELADRGSNDYFTLKLIARLRQANVPITILMSNHTIEFVKAVERNSTFRSIDLGFSQAASLFRLQELIDKKLVTRDEITQLYHDVYKQNFKLIDYSFHEGNITLYTHAGVGLEVIERFARKFNVPFLDGTAKELATTIDAIDAAFQQHIKNNTITSLYNNERHAENASTPFEKLLWHRAFQSRNYVAKCPPQHNGYSLTFVHGHDIHHNDYDKHIINLDNTLGKVVWGNQHHKGEYSIFYTHDHRLNVTPTPVKRKAADPIWLTIDTKITDLKKRGFDTESVLLTTFKTSLQTYVQHFELGVMTETVFTATCKSEFNKIYQSKLAEHRGSKEFLLNLAIMFSTFGMAGLVNLIRTHNRHYFFKFDTDTISKARELETSFLTLPSNAQSNR